MNRAAGKPSRIAALAASVLLVGAAAPPGADPAPTAGADAVTGVLDFRIVDASDRPMPGRLTFVPAAGGEAGTLFPNADARPDDLAVRQNVVYSLSGIGAITVPVGDYAVYASRGIEWSLASTNVAVTAGSRSAWTARLRREVDTTGWISGDFHLHTLTYSGHGDSNMKERIISIAGEGVEFAVATDHNHHTDYGPTIDHLHAGDELTAVTGNEVSVPIGHFNAFPLDPGDAPVDVSLADANELFRLLRRQTNEYGVVPVIQVNHPRWDGIDYFAIGALDPVTGLDGSPRYSRDFDTIEVLNENTGWGYYQPFVDGVPTSGNLHSVVRDWFNLLNRGQRYGAVGNSDSHTVHYAFAGYPRNFVACSTDDPSAIDPVEIARTLRDRRVFTTTGPFVELEVGGIRMGGMTTASDDGLVRVAVRVQAASWIDCDRVHVVVNGDIVETIPVPETREPVRLDRSWDLELDRDSWITVLVEGDDAMSPVVTGGGRAVVPLAVVNPVWVNADEDNVWASPWEQALAAVDASATRTELDAKPIARAGPVERGLVILAAIERGRAYATELIRDGLADADRNVQLCAARGAEWLADPSLSPDLTAAMQRADGDPYLRVALLRAKGAQDAAAVSPAIIKLLMDEATELPSRYLEELTPMLAGDFVDEWLAIGYFPSPEEGTVLRTTISPEIDPDPARTHDGKQPAPAQWTKVATTDGGFLDLRGLAGAPALAENAIALAQTWLECDRDREVAIALGTDDGSRVYLNGEIVYENPARRGAKPFEHVTTWRLRKGRNHVLFKVENGTGGFGIYLRVLDPTVTW